MAVLRSSLKPGDSSEKAATTKTSGDVQEKFTEFEIPKKAVRDHRSRLGQGNQWGRFWSGKKYLKV